MTTDWIATLDQLINTAKVNLDPSPGDYARYPLHNMVAQAWFDPQSPTIEIKLIDVSINGLGFESEFQFETGQQITISFSSIMPHERPTRFEIMWTAVIHGRFRHGAKMI
ncbi:MAG: hypothetical protein ACYTHJ_01760 [Planctomycetota bacterium]|jgi:hypothetical protein